MDRLGRRPRAGARRYFSGALYHRAAPHRARCPHHARRLVGACVDRRGRTAAAQRKPVEPARPAGGEHPQHSDRCRHHRGLCHRLCRLCALRLSAAGRRLPPARHRSLADIDRSSAARAGACRSWRYRRLSGADPGCLRQARLLVALCLSRDHHGGGLRAGALAALALARARRNRAQRAMDAAGNRSQPGRGARRPRLPRRRGFCARRRVSGRRLALRPAGGGRRKRHALDAGAGGLSSGSGVSGRQQPTRRRRAHGLCHSHRRDNRHCLAHRSGDRRGAGGRDPRHGGDGRLGGPDESRRPGRAVGRHRSGDTGTRALRLWLAFRPRRGMGGAVRRRRLPGARPLQPRRRTDAVVRRRRVHAARHAGRALLSHRSLGSVPAVCGSRLARRRNLRHGHRNPGAAPIAAGARGGERDVCDRSAGGARPRARLCAGQGLAHDWSRLAGARRRRGRRQTAAAVAALARCRHGGGRGGARRLRAAHCRHRARHDADIQLAALRLRRRHRSGVPDGCCVEAPTICRRAWSMPAPSCSPCCW